MRRLLLATFIFSTLNACDVKDDVLEPKTDVVESEEDTERYAEILTSIVEEESGHRISGVYFELETTLRSHGCKSGEKPGEWTSSGCCWDNGGDYKKCKEGNDCPWY